MYQHRPTQEQQVQEKEEKLQKDEQHKQQQHTEENPKAGFISTADRKEEAREISHDSDEEWIDDESQVHVPSLSILRDIVKY